ncbi:MAG TPA: BON domain-containing protein [Paraburkholderia sp.]|uniref:BON domain-containing protein n=1 Tax=Paraburkholderia sp. TaxID=1926495 RepID=UPI002B990380|nr:BON domain-containing protein [Paraburkholderia sp.]HTR05435.1 BON domain-containing protein [Paraburkholderia sp.]
MKIRYKVACCVLAASLSTLALAQTPAPTDSAQSADGAPMTTAQIHAERKAERVENKALSKRVQQAIYKTKGLEDAEIAVFATARTGQVILAGMIIDEDQGKLASDVAAKVPGVTSVSNRLSLVTRGGN